VDSQTFADAKSRLRGHGECDQHIHISADDGKKDPYRETNERDRKHSERQVKIVILIAHAENHDRGHDQQHCRWKTPIAILEQAPEECRSLPNPAAEVFEKSPEQQTPHARYQHASFDRFGVSMTVCDDLIERIPFSRYPNQCMFLPPRDRVGKFRYAEKNHDGKHPDELGAGHALS
jgi:hypothetical protein